MISPNNVVVVAASAVPATGTVLRGTVVAAPFFTVVVVAVVEEPRAELKVKTMLTIVPSTIKPAAAAKSLGTEI
jgi:hypothetical protein